MKHQELKLKVPARGNIPAAELYIEHYPVQNGNPNAPTMICLPGGPGGGMGIYKNYQVDKFTKFANVILMDPRGCGNNPPCIKAEYHIDVYIDDIDAIRKHFKLEKWIVLGTSYGSMTAHGYAIRHGEHLQGLVIVNGAPNSEYVELARQHVKEDGSKAQQDMFERLLAGTLPPDGALSEYFEVMKSMYSFKERHHPNSLPSAKRVFNAEAAIAGLGPNGFIRDFNWLPELHKVTCPTLIIVGKQDWVNDPRLLEKTHKAIANSDMHVIDNCGHYIWHDQPEQYFEVIENWLRTISA